MAIARVGTGGGAAKDASTNSATTTATVDSGSTANRVLRAFTYANGADCSGVTYNGSAMTLVKADASNKTKSWILLAPASGSHSLVATNGTFSALAIYGQAYDDVTQSVTADSSNDQTDIFVTDQTIPITTVAASVWLFYGAGANAVVSAGTGAHLVGSADSGDNITMTLFDSNGAVTPAGSHSMQSTRGGATNIVGVIDAFTSAGGGGGGGSSIAAINANLLRRRRR